MNHLSFTATYYGYLCGCGVSDNRGLERGWTQFVIYLGIQRFYVIGAPTPNLVQMLMGVCGIDVVVVESR